MIVGATRRNPHGDPNEDAFQIVRELECAVVLDGAGKARGAAGKIAAQFRRLVVDSPPSSLPDLIKIAKLLDAYAPARTTMAAFRFVQGQSGALLLAVTVGDAKCAVFREDNPVFVSETTKKFLGSGEAEPLADLVRLVRGDLIVLATDGGWTALGGVRIPRVIGSHDIGEALDHARNVMDDSTIVVKKY